MLNNIKIGTRLAIGFATLLILLALISTLSLVNMSVMNSNTEQVTVRYFPQTVMANTIIDSLNISARAIRNIVMSSDVSVMNKQNQRIAESRKAIDDALVEFDKITQSQEGKVLIAAIKQARDTY